MSIHNDITKCNGSLDSTVLILSGIPTFPISDLDGRFLPQGASAAPALWRVDPQRHPVQLGPELRAHLRPLRPVPILRNFATWVEPWEEE